MRTVDLVDDVVGDEEERGAGVEDGGVAEPGLGGAVEGPGGGLDLPEALGAAQEGVRMGS